MKRFLTLAAFLATAAVALGAGSNAYYAYRASIKTPYDFSWSGSAWDHSAGTGASLVLLGMTVGPKGPALNRMAIVDFWTEGTHRYYSVDMITSGLSFTNYGNGSGALILAQSWKPGKVVSGVDLAVLTCKIGDSAPKTLKGTSLTIDLGDEVTRSEVSLKLDSALSAAAAAAAAGDPADPFGAATEVLVAAVEALGYTPEP